MGRTFIGPLGLFFATCFASCLALPADAQDSLLSSRRTPASANSPAALTGKERLGGKWTDEQRIDNCNVPVDKRGTKPRPSMCAHVPSS